MTDSNDSKDLATTPKASAPQISLGASLAAKDPAILMEAVVAKRDTLIALGDDETLPDRMRQVVKDLAALASPSRPGLEEMDGAWTIARANIAQPTSQSDAKPGAAKNGDIYTTSGQLLEKPSGIIPFYIHEENINFPKGGGKNPVCQSPDAKLGSPFGECLKCTHLPFGKQNGGRGDQVQTDCYSNIVVVGVTDDLKQVLKFQFGKTSRKAGAALLALARQQLYVWKQSYLINTEKKTGDLGVYWVYQVAPTGKDNDKDVLRLCEALHGLYHAERQRFLADWYSRPQKAPQVAAQAEGEFHGGALDAGLSTGVEPDLSTPPPVAPGASTRSSAKPM